MIIDGVAAIKPIRKTCHPVFSKSTHYNNIWITADQPQHGLIIGRIHKIDICSHQPERQPFRCLYTKAFSAAGFTIVAVGLAGLTTYTNCVLLSILLNMAGGGRTLSSVKGISITFIPNFFLPCLKYEKCRSCK